MLPRSINLSAAGGVAGTGVLTVVAVATSPTTLLCPPVPGPAHRAVEATPACAGLARPQPSSHCGHTNLGEHVPHHAH